MSKLFTATLILKLVEDQKLKLQDSITQYLPNFPKEKGDKITIHHLLSNTSGIPELFPTTRLENRSIQKKKT